MGRRRPVKNCSADGIRLPRLPLLTDEEVRELKQRIRAGCEDARDELVSRTPPSGNEPCKQVPL